MRKCTSCLLAVVMCASMVVPAFADTASQGAAGLSGGTSENTIPVNISADVTTFDVDVPTAFPTTLDPATGTTTTANNATITNNSYGAIVVKKITAKDNAENEGGTASWHLADFAKDMSQVKVDENLIGLKVQPKSHRSGASLGTALTTTDANAAEQVLLASENIEWVIEGKDATDGSNELTVLYETNASAVSQKIVNKTVANIVIVVGWNTNL